MTILDWIMYIAGTWCILGHLALLVSAIKDDGFFTWYLTPFMATVLIPMMIASTIREKLHKRKYRKMKPIISNYK